MLTDRFEEKKLLYQIQVYGDSEAFGKLYNRYIEKIYRFVFFKVSNRHDAEDLTSEVFLKAWNYLNDKDRAEIEHFSGFIYQVARNTIVDWYRSVAKQAEYSLDAAEGISISVDKLGLRQGIDGEEIYKAIQKLKHEYQELVLLRYIEDMSIKEIMDITGKGSVSVRVTLHRAMNKLKEILEKR